MSRKPPLEAYRVLQAALGRGLPPNVERGLALLDDLKAELRDYVAGIQAAQAELDHWSPDPSDVDDDAGAWSLPASHPVLAPGESYSDEDEERWNGSAEGKRWNAAIEAEKKRLDIAESLLQAAPSEDDALAAITQLKGELRAFAAWWKKAGSKLPSLSTEYKP